MIVNSFVTNFLLFLIICLLAMNLWSQGKQQKMLEGIETALWEQILYMTDDYIKELDDEINGDAENTVAY